MPTISACIVAYCDYEEVCAAVRSILHFTPAPDFTLYIVDNASPDGCGTPSALQKCSVIHKVLPALFA